MTESFQYTSPGFIDANSEALWSGLSSGTSLPNFGPHVTNGGLGDELGMDTGSTYMFPLMSFTTPGTHQTRSGWPNVGTLTIEVTPELSVVNAASHGFSPWAGYYSEAFQLAPGSLARIFGSNDLTTQNSPSSVAELSLLLTDSSGVSHVVSLLSASATSVDFIVPPEATLGNAMLTLKSRTWTRIIHTSLVNTAPGLFTENGNGQGVPAAQLIRQHADGSASTEDIKVWEPFSLGWAPAPISIGPEPTYLTLYGTGIRNGANIGVMCGCGSMNNVAVTEPLVVRYAGPQPDAPGLDQVNVSLPPTLNGIGNIALWVVVDGEYSNQVVVNIK
jgi:uncharacterized protein (TIGR03437 family)